MSIDAKKYFERIVLTFFGIGLLERVSWILSLGIPAAATYYFGCGEIFLIISLIFISVMFIFDKQVVITEMNRKTIVSPRSTCVWLFSSSPFVDINIYWLILGLIIYVLFLELFKNRMISKNSVINLRYLVLYHTVSALATAISIHILFAGVQVLPYIIAFWGR